MPPKKIGKYAAPRRATTATEPKKRGEPERVRPEGMSIAEWNHDCTRRQIENTARRGREVRAAERKAAADQERMVQAAAAAHAASQQAAMMAGMAAAEIG